MGEKWCEKNRVQEFLDSVFFLTISPPCLGLSFFQNTGPTGNQIVQGTIFQLGWRELTPIQTFWGTFWSKKGLVPPRDHEVFLDENHLRGKKSEVFLGSILFILDAIAESNIIFRGLMVSRIQRRLFICLHHSQFTRNALQYNGKGSFC